MKEYLWVPENCIFDSAADCLGAYPGAGPACMVAYHPRYDDLKINLTLATRALDFYANPERWEYDTGLCDAQKDAGAKARRTLELLLAGREGQNDKS